MHSLRSKVARLTETNAPAKRIPALPTWNSSFSTSPLKTARRQATMVATVDWHWMIQNHKHTAISIA